MSRNVKGVLFADYVRMIRAHKDVDWRRHLAEEDLPFLGVPIRPELWYPMATFERLGNAILDEIARGELDLVEQWGRAQIDTHAVQQPALVAAGDPVETLRRFRVFRSTYFDFDALDFPMLHPTAAQVVIHYFMGAKAEEAASWQTLGFFERLLELAGAREVVAAFVERSWTGDERTLLELSWTA